MPPVRPSEALRVKVIREEQISTHSTTDKQKVLQAEVAHAGEVTERAARLCERLGKTGLKDEWFENPDIDPDYPNQSTSFRLRRLMRQTVLETRVSTTLPNEEVVDSYETSAIFNLMVRHAIGDTQLTTKNGIIDGDIFNDPELDSQAVILEPQLRDLVDTLDLIEREAVAKGMEPLQKVQPEAVRPL